MQQIEEFEIGEDLLSKIAEHTNNAVIITDADKKIQYLNKGFTKITGYSEYEVMGKRPGFILQGPETDPDTILRMREKLKNCERVNETIINYSKTGEKYWLKLDIYPIFNEVGECIHFMAIESDVTQMKLNEQKAIEQNARVQDNIQYALRLQNALFRDLNEKNKHFKDLFVLDKPKDTVGGDFYIFDNIQNKQVVFLGDCTGHGVSGAIMTAIVTSSIKELLQKYKTLSPAMILKKARERLRNTLESGSETVKDSFEGTLVFIDAQNKSIRYASYNQDIFIYSPKENLHIKGSREAVLKRKKLELEDQQVSYSEGSMIYLSSDGIKDQFGGEDDKKFMSKRIMQTLEKVHTLSCQEQNDYISNEIAEWRGLREQTDDILMIGVRL
ncbi:MAG: SpoIIE family protein phosphatase [Cyclobacteriaceae bacterium]